MYLVKKDEATVTKRCVVSRDILEVLLYAVQPIGLGKRAELDVNEL
jgi:hypothetical protein